MSLTEDLCTYAEALRLDLVGTCSIERLSGAPEEGRPGRYLESASSCVSIGYRLNRAPVQGLPASRSAYMLEHDYANRHLDRSSHLIARFLEERGHDAVGFDSGAGFYHQAGKTPERFAGDLSHKHVAVACGFGLFGLNNLVLHPRWGPRIRLATVITSAELENDLTGRENSCPAGECAQCVEVCPVGALGGWEGAYDPRKGWVIDKQKCYEYIFTTLKGQRCGLCIKACPVGE